MAAEVKHYRVVIIGSGFGGTMTALPLAEKLKKKGEKILMIERGTWWTTPVSTVQDKGVNAQKFLARKGQPVQFWSSRNDFRGFIDIFTRCFKRKNNEDGLYDMTRFGRPGLLGIFGGKNDDVTIVRASGVGGGSLIYSNITIQPPDFIFDDPRWPVDWQPEGRNHWFDYARHAIGYGVLSALQAREGNDLLYLGKPSLDTAIPAGGYPAAYPGLSNIVVKTARLDSGWSVNPDPNNKRGVKRIDPGKKAAQKYWLDRARVFQTAMSHLTSDYGAVDLSIGDLTHETDADAPQGQQKPPANYPTAAPKNFCERQGRCNIGCLPGARNTLNKQLMTASLGTFNSDDPSKDKDPTHPNLEIEPLSEVDVVTALSDGRYEVSYAQRDRKDLSLVMQKRVTADIVIVAAGCVGTNEIMLRSKQRGALPGLSDRAGYRFSTNGDYIAFLEKTQEWIGLIRGPVTTSFGHFNTEDPATGGNPKMFHTLEDQGVPPALASVIGEGVPLIRSLAKGQRGRLFILHAALRWAKNWLAKSIKSFFTNYRERGNIFRSEEEVVGRMMCVVGMGRDEGIGRFTTGGPGETPLRLRREDGQPFHEDLIYKEIKESLKRLAPLIRDAEDPTSEFINPFLTNTAGAFDATAIAVSHPLGGCVMARSAADGVVDQYGRVFDKTKEGEGAVYENLYIADASIIPTALGVNPSLTISALALRIVDRISKGL